MKKPPKTKKEKILSFMKKEVGYWLGFVSAIITIIAVFFQSQIPLWVYITWLIIIIVVLIVLSFKIFEFIKKSAVSSKEISKKL